MQCQFEKKIAFSTLAAIRFQSWRERCESRQSCSRDLCCVRRRFYARKNGSMVVFTLQKQKFKLKDAARSGRPVGFDEDRLNHLLRENPCQSTRELAEQLTCDQKTVVKHLHSIGKVQKLGVWVPHALSQNNKLVFRGWSPCLARSVACFLGLSHSFRCGKEIFACGHE